MPMLLYIAVLDPHLEIRGVGSNPDPYIRRGRSPKKFFLMFFTPGTSDEHITVVENLRNYSPDGAILVTTPQV